MKKTKEKKKLHANFTFIFDQIYPVLKNQNKTMKVSKK